MTNADRCAAVLTRKIIVHLFELRWAENDLVTCQRCRESFNINDVMDGIDTGESGWEYAREIGKATIYPSNLMRCTG
jgi:hypothetical protein